MTTPSPPPKPTERRVRDALRAAAPQDTHLEAGLADLQGRVAAGAAPTPIGHRRPNRRILAAAAVIVAIAACGLAIVTLTRDDDTSKVISTPNGPAATGWYVPSGLDGDWKLQAVRSFAGDAVGAATCPCVRRTWASGDGASSLLLVESVATQPKVDEVIDRMSDVEVIDGINLGHGITARAATGPKPSTDTFMVWRDDDRRFLLAGSGVSSRHVIDAAHAIVDDGEPSDLSLPGSELVDEVAVPVTLAHYQVVEVTMANATTGAIVTYTLTPPGSEALTVLGAIRKVALPGRSAPVLRVEEAGQEIDNAPPVASYLDRRPGASVVASVQPDDVASASADDAEAAVRAVLASLEPAGAGEWAAFVRSAVHPAHDANDLLVGSLMDLADGPGGSEPEPTETTASAPVTTSSSTTVAAGSPEEPAYPAKALTFQPVLEVQRCRSGLPAVIPDEAGEYCYRLGPQVATGEDLFQAAAVEEQSWAVSVRARPDSVSKLNDLFNACFRADETCPALDQSGRGGVAILLNGLILSAPQVNGLDLADDAFMITGAMTDTEASDLAAAINAG
jgi:hypothetical protein